MHALSARLIDALIAAAQRGWGPEELLHVLGPQAHPLIYRAAPQIPAKILSPRLRHDWLMVAPPPDPFFDIHAVADWYTRIRCLPALRDVTILDMPVDPHSRAAKIRRKVEALLAKAESTSFPAEAESLLARAQALRQTYRLESADEPHSPIISHRILIPGPYVKHKVTLLSAICAANGVTCLLLHDSGIATILGLREDVDHAADLFASLSRQCAHTMENSPGMAAAKANKSTAAYRRSFQLSYAHRVGELLQTANHSSGQDDNLPVLVRRAELAENARDSLFPQLNSISLSSHHYAGHAAGREAAEASHFRGDSAGLRPHQRALSA